MAIRANRFVTEYEFRTKGKQQADAMSKAVDGLDKNLMELQQTTAATGKEQGRFQDRARRALRTFERMERQYDATAQRAFKLQNATKNLQVAVRQGLITTDEATRRLRALARSMDEAANAQNRLRGGGILGRAGSAARGALGAFGIGFGAFGAAQGAREIVQNAIVFERLDLVLQNVTGSAEQAERAFGLIVTTAQQAGIGVAESARGFSTLVAAVQGTALQGSAIEEVFQDISKAVSGLSLDAQATERVFRAFTQILSKGKVQAEELRGQLGDVLPGAFRIAAESIGVTTAELDEMLKRGEVISEEFLPQFARALGESFGPGIEQTSNLAKAFERLRNEVKLLAEAITEATGLTDLLEGAAIQLRRFSEFTRGVGGLVDNQILRLQEEIQKRQEAITEARERQARVAAGETSGPLGLFPTSVRAVQEEIDALRALQEIDEARLETLQRQRRIEQSTRGPGEDTGVNVIALRADVRARQEEEAAAAAERAREAKRSSRREETAAAAAQRAADQQRKADLRELVALEERGRQRANSLLEQTLTLEERHFQQITEIVQLQREGFLNAEEAARVRLRLENELTARIAQRSEIQARSTEELTAGMQRATELGRTLGETLEDAVVGALTGAENSVDRLRNAIGKMLVEFGVRGVFNQLSAGLGITPSTGGATGGASLLGGLFGVIGKAFGGFGAASAGPTPFAGVPSGTPLAAGGVVTRPSRRLIGEEGPEAVLPLRRDAQGNLGVSVAGSSRISGGGMAGSTIQAVSVTIRNEGTPQEVRDTQVRQDPVSAIIEVITADVSRGGPIAGTLENTYRGLRRG